MAAMASCPKRPLLMPKFCKADTNDHDKRVLCRQEPASLRWGPVRRVITDALFSLTATSSRLTALRVTAQYRKASHPDADIPPP